MELVLQGLLWRISLLLLNKNIMIAAHDETLHHCFEEVV